MTKEIVRRSGLKLNNTYTQEATVESPDGVKARLQRFHYCTCGCGHGPLGERFEISPLAMWNILLLLEDSGQSKAWQEAKGAKPG